MKLRSILLCGALSVATLPAADTLTGEFQRALFEEEANRNLPAAIAGYEAVIKRLDEQRQLAATAVFRLGESYRKLGKTNEAVAAYERIIKEFADQETLVKLSGQNLSILRPVGDPLDTYVVQSGDTLSRIARQYNVSTRNLEEWNPGLDFRRFRVGDRIRVGSRVSESPFYANASAPGSATAADLAELRRLEILLETVRSLEPMSEAEIRTLNEFANDSMMVSLAESWNTAKSHLAGAEAHLLRFPDSEDAKNAVRGWEGNMRSHETGLKARRATALRMLEARVEAARRLAGRGDAVSGASGGSQAGDRDASMLALRVEGERLKQTLDQLTNNAAPQEAKYALVRGLLPDATLAKLDEMAVAARVELAGVSSNYGPEHGDVKAARAKLDEINKSVDERISAVIAAAHFKLKSLEQVVAAQRDRLHR